MIEINLLPKELRVVTKKIDLKTVQPVYFLYAIAAILCILILGHIYLAGAGIVSGIKLRSLNARLNSFDSLRDELDSFKKERDMYASDAKAMQQLLKQRIEWAEKLNAISRNLPMGVWLNDVSFSQKDFTMKCSAVSLQKEEFTLINKFIDNLKKDGAFFKIFGDLKLGSTQKRTIGTYEVVDFTVNATYKKQK